MNFNWFGSVIVHHPFLILIGVAVFSSTCLIIPFTLKSLPNFTDPQMGFQTRGTSLSDKVTTWINLVEATKERGPLTVNPKQFMQRENISSLNKLRKKKIKKDKNRKKFVTAPTIVIERPYTNYTDQSEQNWRDLKAMLKDADFVPKKYRFRPDKHGGFFCGPPTHDYAHIVLRSTDGSDLFNVESLILLCHIERELIDNKHFSELCVMKRDHSACCRPWSLANYVAFLNNRPSCLSITEEDINSTKILLQSCSQYFHRMQLLEDCDKSSLCKVPIRCQTHNAVYSILNYLTSTSFLPLNKTSDVILTETIIYVPLARSTAMLPFYHEIEKAPLDFGDISVVAMDFGVKTALFDEYLVKDTWLMCIGGLFVVVCMWLYTGSLFLTIMTIIAIVFSLGVSYFTYTIVFELHFFPFMNLLMTIVALGIGADDAFIFCKIWQIMRADRTVSLVKVMENTMQHALSSMFVTSITTSAAFMASYISSITAIKCFSIFASISVLANCFLMVLWFPASVVIYETYSIFNKPILRGCLLAVVERWSTRPPWALSLTWYIKFGNVEKFFADKEKKFIEFIVEYKKLWFIFLTSLAVASSFIVLYYPRLQLPTSPEFQLFENSHLFEQYDLKYKNLFWFADRERTDLVNNIHVKLPLRFVWGVLPHDDGNFLDPQSLGTLKMDDDFNMSHPDSQVFLLNFCKSLRKQPFYSTELGVIIPTCFIESFITWMDRSCRDDIDNSDHSPCCENNDFPYDSALFDLCIVDAMGDMYETIFFRPGVAGPKFSKEHGHPIKAVVVEYDSNYSFSFSYDYMDKFIHQVEKWFKDQLDTAPDTMKRGWFMTSFEFYDLQKTLSESTIIAVALSLNLALAVLFAATTNVVISFYAIFNIACSIFVTMAVLVLLGWKLNILESVTVSTAIGLTIDFSLHYTVNYKLAPLDYRNDREESTKFSLSHMLKPVTMAALTTGMVGAFMMPSAVLAYVQIGSFLLIVMVISWFYSTFHLGSLLALAGPRGNFGQCNFSQLLCRNWRANNALGKRPTASSSSSDTHELDLLTNSKSLSNSSAPNLLNRSPNGSKQGSSRFIAPDQSPSAISAITVITADDI